MIFLKVLLFIFNRKAPLVGFLKVVLGHLIEKVYLCGES